METEQGNPDLVNEVFRPMHSIKGNAPFFGFTNMRTLAHALETLLAAIRSGSKVVTREVASLLLEGIDEIRGMLTRLRSGQPEVLEQLLLDAVVKRVRDENDRVPGAFAPDWQAVLSKLLPLVARAKIEAPDLHKDLAGIAEQFEGMLRSQSSRAGAASKDASRAQAPVAAPPASPQPPPAMRGKETKKVMRISEENVDTFLAYVGELIVIGEMLSFLQQRLAKTQIDNSIITQFRRLNETFVKLSDDLQRSIMSIRKVSIQGLLHKAQRIIRDIATASNREIKVVLQGEDIEVDKSISELLDAPLVHMARNAADHGVESPDIRISRGKPAAGEVLISVEQSGEFVKLTVRDDGGGLNLDGLRRKARELGIIREGEALSEDRLTDLIFSAGVSTAEQVTDISGRGVGLDVVKRSIEEAGGTIGVSSLPGRGTVFSIKVPSNATTQIMSGVVVEIGGQPFVLPIERVLQTVECNENEIFTTPGGGQFVNHAGSIQPIVPAAQLLGIEGAIGSCTGASLFVSVLANREKMILKVDRVLGVHQVVLKKLEGLDCTQEIFSGSALMGDGGVGFVIDLDRFCPR